MNYETEGAVEEYDGAISRVRENCERMFGVFDLYEGQNNVFYKTLWDEEDSRRIIGITTFSLELTGARRQEIRGPLGGGRFRQAQYVVTEAFDETSTEERYYAWLPTLPSGALEDIVIDKDALRHQTGLRALTDHNLLYTLLGSVDSLAEHIYLLELVGKRGIDTPDALERQTQTVGGRAIAGILSNRWNRTISDNDAREELEEVFYSLKRVDSFVSKALQSRTLSLMLQSLPAKLGEEFDKKRRDEVLGTLKFGLDSGLLPEEERIVGRALMHPAIYSDPYFTRYLSKTLHDSRFNRPSSGKIFGFDREIVAHDLILATLHHRVHSINEPGEVSERVIRKVTGRTMTRGTVRRDDDFQFLYQLADSLGYADNSDRGIEQIRRDRANYIMQYEEICLAYEYTLKAIQHENPDSLDEELDTERILSIRMILGDQARRKMNRLHGQALKEYSKWQLERVETDSSTEPKN